MKSLSRIFLLCITSIILFSCSKGQKELDIVDFGDEEFEEPFRGPLESRPSILVKSLQIPPFSWLSSDTISLKEKFELEDSLNVKADSKFFIVDENLQSFDGLHLKDKNGKNVDFYTIKNDVSDKDLEMELAIDPSLGDTVCKGYILMVNPNNADNQNPIKIAKWEIEQEIGWPCMIWLLWLAITACIIGAIVYLIYIFINFLIRIYPSVRDYTISKAIKFSVFVTKSKDSCIYLFTRKKYKKVFYENTVKLQRKSQINNNGDNNGSDTIYYISGKTNKESHWKNGIRDGAFTVYWPNGKKYIEGYYSNGKLKGKYTVYSEDQEIIMQKEY